MELTISQFFERLRDSDILPPGEVDALWKRIPKGKRDEPAARLIAKLPEVSRITEFQATALVEGRGDSLVLGDYVLERIIGTGGMGQVFLASHRRMKRKVALKVLSPAVTERPDALKRFQREVEAAAKLLHPNIVAALDAGEQKGIHFLVMEYVDGEDLAHVVRGRGPLPVGEALSYVSQAAKGLAHSHRLGIIHRDMKPANLLVDKQGAVKILDMGLVRFDGQIIEEVSDEITQSGMLMGTVDFMSPEQAVDTKNADPRSDIYSLGCTLWFLLTGRRMYDGETMMSRLVAHRDDPLPDFGMHRNDIEPEVQRLFEKLVAKRPVERFQTMEEVIAALKKCRVSALATVDASSVHTMAETRLGSTLASSPAENRRRESNTIAVQSDSATQGDTPSLRKRGSAYSAPVKSGDWLKRLASAEGRPGRQWWGAGAVAALTLVTAAVFFVWRPWAHDDGAVAGPPDSTGPKVPATSQTQTRVPWLEVGMQVVDEELELRVPLLDPRTPLLAGGKLRIVSGSAYGASVDAASGVFSWTPTEAQGPGKYQFAITLEHPDHAAAANQVMFDVDVREVNSQPTIAPIPEQTATLGRSLILDIRALDVDLPASELRYALIDAPSEASLDAKTGRLQFMASAAQVGTKQELFVRVSELAPAPQSAEIRVFINVARADAASVGENAPAPTSAPPIEERTIANSIGMQLVYIPGGEFEWKDSAAAKATPRKIRVTKPFYLAAHEVTQSEYEMVMGTLPSYFSLAPWRIHSRNTKPPTGRKPRKGERDNAGSLLEGPESDPSGAAPPGGPPPGSRPTPPPGYGSSPSFPGSKPRTSWLIKAEAEWEAFHDSLVDQPTARFPVECVTWENAVEFCRRLNSMSAEVRAGRRYRLPTEAEWELACRAGTETAYHVGDLLASSQANFDGNVASPGRARPGKSLGRTTKVGSYKPNAFGLFDMHGNVSEWCADCFEDEAYRHLVDPAGPPDGTRRVVRGGHWQSSALDCAATSRAAGDPMAEVNHVGLRVVCELAPLSPEKPGTFIDPPKGEIVNSLDMKLAYVPAGEFEMGAPDDEDKTRALDENPHSVVLPRAFHLGVYEVTQHEYERIMGLNPSWYTGTGLKKAKVTGLDTKRFPVERVDYENADEFCRKLSARQEEVAAGRLYRLPSEAEWEYACRAGTKSPYSFGASCNGAEANCRGASPFGTTIPGRHLARPTTVGSYTANAFGLYDMHGNVAEWCVDWLPKWHRAYPGRAVDPRGAFSGESRIVRGGSWDSTAVDCRSAHRGEFLPNRLGSGETGFRVVCEHISPLP